MPFTDEQLKNAYRLAAKKHHPDMGGSSEEFIKAKDAYEFLKPYIGGVTSGDPLQDFLRDIVGIRVTVNVNDLRRAREEQLRRRAAQARRQRQYMKCPTCNGTGYVTETTMVQNINLATGTVTASFGERKQRSCNYCGGRGRF